MAESATESAIFIIYQAHNYFTTIFLVKWAFSVFTSRT